MVAQEVRSTLIARPLRGKNGRSFGVISVIREPWLIYNIGAAPALLAIPF
jgi:hypothetical protein